MLSIKSPSPPPSFTYFQVPEKYLMGISAPETIILASIILERNVPSEFNLINFTSPFSKGFSLKLEPTFS